MTDKAAILALIEKLAAAPEGEWKLDNEVVWTLSDWANIGGGWRRHKVTGERESFNYTLADPKFTSSIEDALTLLPEWASYELMRSAAGDKSWKRCRLWDWRRSPKGFDPTNEWMAEGNSTLPLMICIAALKARADQ